MGYESILIVAETMDGFGDGRTMIRPVATFDLSKMGYDGDFAELVKARKSRLDADRYYWYPQLAWGPIEIDAPEDEQRYFGDQQQSKDAYAEPPTTMDFDTTILALEASDDGYRRIAPVIAALKVYAEQLAAGKWDRDRFGLFHIGH
jgi:hypothetical protein